jgi:hypothetical protein
MIAAFRRTLSLWADSEGRGSDVFLDQARDAMVWAVNGLNLLADKANDASAPRITARRQAGAPLPETAWRPPVTTAPSPGDPTTPKPSGYACRL